MFTHIKTSKANKEAVTSLTKKLNLGAENMIAKLAYAYSLSKDYKLNLKDLEDSGGKEYSKSVLFGDSADIYLGMLCVKYQIYKTDKDLGKYVKLHLDDGLTLFYEEIKNSNLESVELLIQKIATANENIFSV